VKGEEGKGWEVSGIGNPANSTILVAAPFKYFSETVSMAGVEALAEHSSDTLALTALSTFLCNATH